MSLAERCILSLTRIGSPGAPEILACLFLVHFSGCSPAPKKTKDMRHLAWRGPASQARASNFGCSLSGRSGGEESIWLTSFLTYCLHRNYSWPIICEANSKVSSKHEGSRSWHSRRTSLAVPMTSAEKLVGPWPSWASIVDPSTGWPLMFAGDRGTDPFLVSRKLFTRSTYHYQLFSITPYQMSTAHRALFNDCFVISALLWKTMKARFFLLDSCCLPDLLQISDLWIIVYRTSVSKLDILLLAFVLIAICVEIKLLFDYFSFRCDLM